MSAPCAPAGRSSAVIAPRPRLSSCVPLASSAGSKPGFSIRQRSARRGTLTSESGVRREQLLQRVRHFTQGVIIGSRNFIDEWFERNRSLCRGASRKKRRSGARPMGRDWQGFYALRQLR